MHKTLVIEYLCASTSVSPAPTQDCAKETIEQHKKLESLYNTAFCFIRLNILMLSFASYV